MKHFGWLLQFCVLTSHAVQQKMPLPPHFPKYPLDGLFLVVDSRPEAPLPPLERLPPNGYDATLLFPGQLVRFTDQGDWGSERPEWRSAELTLYPPFPIGICQHMKFHYICDDKTGPIPTTPIVRDMVVEFDRLTEDLAPNDSRLPLADFGARKGKYLQVATYADKTGSFVLYFQDWNTLVSLGTYWVGRGKDEYGPGRGLEIDKWKAKTVIQILKRVKE